MEVSQVSASSLCAAVDPGPPALCLVPGSPTEALLVFPCSSTPTAFFAQLLESECKQPDRYALQDTFLLTKTHCRLLVRLTLWVECYFPEHFYKSKEMLTKLKAVIARTPPSATL